VTGQVRADVAGRIAGFCDEFVADFRLAIEQDGEAVASASRTRESFAELLDTLSDEEVDVACDLLQKGCDPRLFNQLRQSAATAPLPDGRRTLVLRQRPSHYEYDSKGALVASDTSGVQYVDLSGSRQLQPGGHVAVIGGPTRSDVHRRIDLWPDEFFQDWTLTVKRGEHLSVASWDTHSRDDLHRCADELPDGGMSAVAGVMDLAVAPKASKKKAIEVPGTHDLRVTLTHV